MLELVGYHEGDLSPAGLVAPVIAANSDDFALVLDHVGHPIEAIDDVRCATSSGSRLRCRLK